MKIVEIAAKFNHNPFTERKLLDKMLSLNGGFGMFRRTVLLSFCLFVMVSPIHAQGVATNFDAETTANSIKCEIGKFAASVPKQRLGAQANKIRVTVTNTSDDTNGGSINIGTVIASLFKFGGTASREVNSSTATTLTYNFDAANSLQNCRKRKLVSPPGIGLYSCLDGDRFYFNASAEKDGPDLAVVCSVTVTVKKGISVSGGVPVYILTIGGGFDFATVSSYKLDISIPPPAKG